jgi:glyoxylase-like metal-dependent hydrolase (beta-lactamase superfamily II)
MYGDSELVDEAFLSALGVFRFPTPLAFLEAGGPANVYALENPDSTWTLFDTGIGTPDALAALRSLASDAGVDLARVSDIIVSHGHLDHFGNAQLLSERTGARVWVHPADLGKVVGDERHADMLVRHRSYLLALGLEPTLLDAMAERAARGWHPRYVERSRLSMLEEGQLFRFKHFDAVVRHLPGHTLGLVCLHVPAQRLFFADDHVLAKVSPNPLLDLSQGEGETKFLALVRYLESAK